MKKRTLNADGDDPTVLVEERMKKRRAQGEEEEEEEMGFSNLDEDLLFEVLKHVDARSLAMAGCVSKLWYKTAQDERLWEMICTRHSSNLGCGNQQLRSVVHALGGFRRLHSLGLWPLLKPPISHSSRSVPSSSSSAFPGALIPAKNHTKWGKDEVHLSLSLLSIRYYEKMSINKRGR
nr:F-box protein GID2 [Chimonanthus praecox]